MILTHPGDERIGGLLGLARRYRIGQVLQTPSPYVSAEYEQWFRELQEANVPIAAADAGICFQLGYGKPLDVLNPGLAPVLGKDGELDLKANSLVLRLSWGRTNALLLGDAPRTIQEQLVEGGAGSERTMIKVPDGGRQAAFSQKLMESVGRWPRNRQPL